MVAGSSNECMEGSFIILYMNFSQDFCCCKSRKDMDLIEVDYRLYRLYSHFVSASLLTSCRTRSRAYRCRRSAHSTDVRFPLQSWNVWTGCE